MQKLGQVVNDHRNAQGLTLRDLAKTLKVTAPTVQRIERGKEISAPTLRKVMDWLFQ